MDLMIWVVTIALFALVGWAIYRDPPSSGCLSADAARARDEKLKPRVKSAPPSRSPAEPENAASQSPPVDESLAVAEEERAVLSDVLRNPMTGETAGVPTSYRFAKRWIKEAMVTEGLLDKVYGSSELDSATSEKVKTAIKDFRRLAKYRG
jgi:hypothetical protein